MRVNETQGVEDVVIIQVYMNTLSDYLNVITNADGRGTFRICSFALEFSYPFIVE